MAADAPNPRETLDLARKAFRSGDFPVALELYDHFFEHALDDDPYSLYGVRLSYCLDEWARLGKRYPLALERLKQKGEIALRLFASSRNPERFHDYVAICEFLKCPDQSMREFLAYHHADRDLAQPIVRFVWNALVASERWEVCACYVASGIQHYEVALASFDRAMTVCNSNPKLGGEEFAAQIEGWYILDVTNLVLVLRNSARGIEASAVLQRAASDCTERGRVKMLDEIHARVGH